MRLHVLLVVAASCASEPAIVHPVASKHAPTVVTIDPTVLRGAYLAKLAGCVSCHSDEQMPPLAGGRTGKLLDGRMWRSPNITPDRTTGIGKWTSDDIVVAIREGIRPDGVRLAPVMPYAYYHHMTDDDARAIATYLRAQAPIHHAVEDADRLPPPVVLAPPRDNVDPGDVRGHGEYLANLMHCGACHTPRDGDFANVTLAGGTQFVAGGRTIIASNLTPDPSSGIGTWSEADLIRAVRTMHHPDGSSILGPMAAYRDAWSSLTDRDAHALAVYLKSLPPVRNPVERHQVTGMAD
jgi:mono/diheme cytochrome c family protein